MAHLKNIIFDLGGVLAHLNIERCRAAYRSLGMHAVADLLHPSHACELLERLERGDNTFAEICDQMRQMTGCCEVTNEQIAWAYGEFITEIPLRKLRLIERLREKGVHTYVLSNNNEAAMQAIRQHFLRDGKPMEEYFDKVYLSYQMKALKPSPAIFQQMIADSGMKPEESLFIDDSPRNIEAAHALGFQVYLPAQNEDFAPLLEAWL